MEDSADFASKNQEQAQEEIAEGGEDINKFAVVDVETTGFGAKDRIIELGIILIDEDKITHEWETLVNPERDISNSDIHGITASMVSLAPTFKERTFKR
jgi:DNA polymerase III epsilon subunit-like protein